ncbi:pre-mRNA-splicing factor cwc22 [Savitreella phatthalungensis]
MADAASDEADSDLRQHQRKSASPVTSTGKRKRLSISPSPLPDRLKADDTATMVPPWQRKPSLSEREAHPRSAYHDLDAPEDQNDGDAVTDAERRLDPRARSRRSASPPPRDHRPRRHTQRSQSRERRRENSRSRSPRRPHRSRDELLAGHRVKAHAPRGEVEARAEFERLMNTRAGGTYVPPAKLRALQASFMQKGTKEYQRMAWEGLKKAINGLINKVNKANIKHVAADIFKQNLIRGRALFARSIMKAQSAALPYTPIYAALAAIVNSKLPQVGELLLTRLIIQFRKAYRRNDKAMCLASTTFLAHLCNLGVAHEIVVLQLLALLLDKPTDSSVEIAVGLMREVGAFLAEASPKAYNGVFDRLRQVLQEAAIDKRSQYMVEVLFQQRKEAYKDNPIVQDGLDLVDEEEQIQHYIGLDDDDLDPQDQLAIFQFDEAWDETEAEYAELRKEILGVVEEEAASAQGESNEDSLAKIAEDIVAEEDARQQQLTEERKRQEVAIQDETSKQLTALRRNIYLNIMSSVDFEEATHKLLKIKLAEGQEIELCKMVVECCSQERAFGKFYGHVSERLCKLQRRWRESFERCFDIYYDTIHRYEANKLRNIARLFGHLLGIDVIGWHVLACVRLTEDDTTASSRIFLKILFQDLQEQLGLRQLAQRMADPALQPALVNVFPKDDPVHTRFCINYFTSIGLGALTDDMREHLKNLPPPSPAPRRDDDDDRSYSSGFDSDSYSDSSDSRYSSSRWRSRTPPPRRSRARSYSRSSPDERSRGRSLTRSPERSRGRRERSYSSSRSSSRGRYRRRSPIRSRSRSEDQRDLRVRPSSTSYSRRPRSHASSDSRSRSPPRRSRGRRRNDSPGSNSESSRSRSPPRRRSEYRRRSASYDSRSPPPRRRARSRSRSRRYSSSASDRSRGDSRWRTPATKQRARRGVRSPNPPPSTTRAVRERERRTEAPLISDTPGPASRTNRSIADTHNLVSDTPSRSSQNIPATNPADDATMINPDRLRQAPWLQK